MPTGHTRRPITTIYGSKRVFPHKVVVLGGISGAQMDFVGGPALKNYNSKWRRPPSWIFAQTAITQPPIDVDE